MFTPCSPRIVAIRASEPGNPKERGNGHGHVGRRIALGEAGRKGRAWRLPLDLLGGGDPASWGYAVALLSQEGYPSSGVRRVRDVLPAAEQWALGGAPATGVTHTRIIDLLLAEEGLQELVLSTYTAADSVAELSVDDLAQIPLITAR